MADSSKLRLVRCPKCENLLPELPDYSVYQCGGCGAVLRAKKGTLDGNNGSKRSDEERIGVVCDKSDNISSKSEDIVGKETVPGIENADNRVSDNEGSSETDNLSSKSENCVGKKTISVADNGEGRVSDSEGGIETIAQRFRNGMKREVGKWVADDGNSDKNELSNGTLDSKVDKLETRIGNADGLRISDRMFERRLSDRREEEQFGRIRRGFDRLRLSSSSQTGEGTSKYDLDSSYRSEATKATRPEYMDPDREELLRKLDELKEQLSKVQSVKEKSREKSPLEHRMAQVEPYAEIDDYFRNHTLTFNRASRQFSASNKHIVGPPYMEHYREPFPYINRSDMNMYNYPGSMQASNHNPRYEDAYESHMFRKPPPPPPPPPPRRIHSHHQYLGPEPESFDPHVYNMNLHHLSCSCYQCYDRQAQLALQMQSSAYGDRGFPHVINKGVPCYPELHSSFGPHAYNPRMASTQSMSSCDPPPRTKWPTEVKSEMGPQARAQRVVLTNGRRYQPVVGGAPFVTCHNCFELLKLPKKVCSKKGEWKMSCGACSSVNMFVIEDEKLVSVDMPSKQVTTEALVSSNDVMVRGHVKRNNASFCSEDYANSVYDFQAMDREPLSSSTCQGVSSSKSEETHNLSATTSEDERFSEDLADRHGVTSAGEHENGVATSPSPLGSPQDAVDYASTFRAVNRCGKGNLSSRSDQDRVITTKGTMRQNSLKESLATEMDISLNDYPNTTTDVCREDEQPKGKKGGDSFLAGIIKKSFRDFSRSNTTVESGKRNVTINGHPIPDKLVKKAEKLAGPIYPGQYWYDYRAGFWGVMGGPCLGIIPPFVEEFNYPMPENCAGGNTGIFVNGRELHQKDLELLSTRGLPVARGRSYIIEISGRVVDEDSGEELDSLGKLAPTVEKVKHGFGMRAPKASA